MKKVALLFILGVFLTDSCTKKEQEVQVPNVSFTPCQQTKSTKSEVSGKVDVEFTKEGVKITYYNFEVTCDFSIVNVTHSFVNGFLNIMQQGSPNQANCICHTDVSYTINGISQNEVNVIFINGEQVYCHNNSGEDEDKEPYDNDMSGIYVVGAWYEPVVGTTKSSSSLSNFTSVTWSDHLRTSFTSGNWLHLSESESSQYENNRIKNSTGGGNIAKLWKNGKMQTLSNNWSMAYSVYVTDNDVYVAGIAGGGIGAAVWKNGKVQDLTPGAIYYTEASSVYVSNGDVYVVGSEWNFSKQAYIAKLWINGEAYDLSCGNTSMFAKSVYVSDGDVYVAGLELPHEKTEGIAIVSGIAIAKLWINGREQNLTNGTINANALSVCVSGNDVYVSGFEGGVTRLWKNGMVQNFNSGARGHANSVFVSGGDVYVSGDKTVWKNGNVLYQMDGNYVFESMFVSGSDVYVTGNEYVSQGSIPVAKLWKNGAIQDISNGSTESWAMCVFVK